MLDQLKSQDFAVCLNETFILYPDTSDPLPARLIEVEDLEKTVGKENRSEHRQPFSLVFRLPRETTLRQKIYRLENQKLGRLDIFLVPIGPDREGMRYEAIFN